MWSNDIIQFFPPLFAAEYWNPANIYLFKVIETLEKGVKYVQS